MQNAISANAPGLPSRRRALATLAAAGAALAVAPQAAKAATPSDPLPALYAEKVRVCALLKGVANDEEGEPLMDRWGACDAAATATPATTVAGAAASIEWVRVELLQFGFDSRNPDNGTRLVLALLDGALGVLRTIGSEA